MRFGSLDPTYHSGRPPQLAFLYIRIYDISVEFTFDATKNARNVATRGISFNQVAGFEWDSALIVEDTRKDYGERRFQALGLIAARLHVLVFTRREAKVHVISLRKANKREVKQYEAQA
jgi:uncharacterized protein